MRLLALAACCAVLVACGDKGSSTTSPSSSSASSAGAAGPVGKDVADAKAAAGTVNGRCPVQTDKLVADGAPTRMAKDPATGKDVKVGFCCSKCPKEFDKDPAKYMKVMAADPNRFGYAP